MFKLVILILMHANSGHTMKVEVGGLDSFATCNTLVTQVTETAVGWGRVPEPVNYPKPILSIHCEKED